MKKFLIFTFLFLPLLFTNSCTSYGREIAYANFSDLPEGPVETDGYNINGLGWDKNSEHKNGLTLPDKGSFVSLQFYVNDIPAKAFLAVDHASATSATCSNGGYSPVTIKLNNNIVVSNFSPASHSYSTKEWNITSLLKTGENVISWTAGDLCSSYLLKDWRIFDNSEQYYYAANFNGLYRNYDSHHKYYAFRTTRILPNNQFRFYEFNQRQNKSNNRHEHYERHEKKRNRR